VTALDDQCIVLLLACETEHRSDAEQDALLRVAAKADAQANADVVTNRRQGPAWRLYRFVEDTRILHDGDRPRGNAKTLSKLDAQADRWDSR
jgi:hypothetical protein